MGERRHGGQHGRWIATSSPAADAPPVIIEIAARFRLPTRTAANRVADRIARDHEGAHVTVARARLLHPQAGWSVFVRLPQNRIGLERIRLVTDGFTELAEANGGEMVWQATRPRRIRQRRRRR
jgi:hypothetical protein